MKRLIALVVILALAVPGLQARKPKKKAGTVDERTFTDGRYGYSFKLPEGWRYKIGKDKKSFRIVLTQKNYEIPPDYIDAPDYTLIPRIVVYAGTTNMAPFPFLDSLLSDSYSSDDKKEMLKEFEIFHDYSEGRERLVPRSRKAITVDNHKAVFWEAQGKYTKEVSLSSSSTGGGGKRVIGAYGGAVVVLEHEGSAIVFHLICEWNYYPSIKKELLQLVSSIKFIDKK
jgi:hypothetical protein